MPSKEKERKGKKREGKRREKERRRWRARGRRRGRGKRSEEPENRTEKSWVYSKIRFSPWRRERSTWATIKHGTGILQTPHSSKVMECLGISLRLSPATQGWLLLSLLRLFWTYTLTLFGAIQHPLAPDFHNGKRKNRSFFKCNAFLCQTSKPGGHRPLTSVQNQGEEEGERNKYKSVTGKLHVCNRS